MIRVSAKVNSDKRLPLARVSFPMCDLWIVENDSQRKKKFKNRAASSEMAMFLQKCKLSLNLRSALKK